MVKILGRTEWLPPEPEEPEVTMVQVMAREEMEDWEQGSNPITR